MQQKQEAEKIELEKKLKDYEGEMKAKENELLLMKKGNQEDENKEKTSNEINLKKSNELYTQGKKLYNLGENGQPKEYEKALKMLQEAAELGNADACYWVGIINEKGKGIDPNLKEAFRNFKKAAKLGDAWGYNKTGQYYQYGKGVKVDFEKAKECYSKAIEIGISDEDNINIRLKEMENQKLVLDLYDQAQNCIDGQHGKKRDLNQAFNLIKKAVDIGFEMKKGPYLLGNLYENGQGCEKNFQEALKSYEISAAAGESQAFYKIAEFYRNGLGVNKDAQKAVKNYQDAIKLGFFGEDIENKLNQLNKEMEEKKLRDELYQQGDDYYSGKNGKPKDYFKSFPLIKQSADLNHPWGLYWTAWMYMQGEGTNKNYSEALIYFKRAAECGETRALRYIADFYLNGYGVDIDEKEALKYYNMAFEATKDEEIKKKINILKKKNEDSLVANNLYELGDAYYQGTNGKSQDYVEAFKLIKQSADLDHKYGLHWTGYMYMQGKGIEKNYKEAQKYFIKSLNYKDKDAAKYLGDFYKNGDGVPVNKQEAIRYYKLALELGFNQNLIESLLKELNS